MTSNTTKAAAFVLILILTGSGFADDQILTVQYFDGLPKLTVSSGTDFRAIQIVSTALKAEGFNHLDVTVTPDGLPNVQSDQWIHVAIDWTRGRQDGVLLCVSENTHYATIAAVANAFFDENSDRVHLISKCKFDSIVIANSQPNPPLLSSKSATPVTHHDNR